MRYIYAICDPISKEIRYIGQTGDVKRRVSKFNYQRNSKTAMTRWVSMLHLLNMRPSFEVLEIIPRGDGANAYDYKTRMRENYWINVYRNKGNNLFNVIPKCQSPRWDEKK